MAVTINVLVADDSALMQRIITKLLESEPGIRVVGTADDGRQAIECVGRLSPHVVVMDIDMPNMDGLAALQHIMQQRPTPVVMVSGVSDASATLRALELGAIDFVAKPSGPISIDLYEVRDELIAKVKLASLADPAPIEAESIRAPLPPAFQSPSGRLCLVAIAASTGGPQTLGHIFRQLPSGLPTAILVVQHMPAGFTATFAERLDRHSPVNVREARDGETIRSGVAYVAPGGVHMAVVKEGRGPVLRMEETPPVNAVRPSADVLMSSVALVAGRSSVGIVLTGMGKDGSDGLAQIKRAGGATIAQDEESSIVFGMPGSAIGQGVVDRVLPLLEIPAALVDAVRHCAGEVKPQ
ncbi:MAG: chemotaxis-specific protein-glutamate methyltransferase CheB [Ardenticatenales bacterium]|nr:chemotaxis-specific protein-glutamate methyltransferase CheB [Ardenticatenales bacterium]